MSDVLKIKEAALKLDPSKDGHWTADGEAKLDSLKFIAGFPISRDELNAALPGFNRESLRQFKEAAQGGGNAAGQGSGSGSGAAPVVTEQPKVEGSGPSRGTPDVEALAAEVDRANEAVDELVRVQEQVRKDLAAAVAARDAAIQAFEAIVPKETFTDINRQFLASQRASYQRRAEAVAAVRASGVSLQAVAKAIGKSPLDQALANKRRR